MIWFAILTLQTWTAGILTIGDWNCPQGTTSKQQRAEPLDCFCIELLLLILVNWYPDNADWICFKEPFLNRWTNPISFFFLYFWWVVDWREGWERLKKCIKVGWEKYMPTEEAFGSAQTWVSWALCLKCIESSAIGGNKTTAIAYNISGVFWTSLTNSSQHSWC